MSERSLTPPRPQLRPPADAAEARCAQAIARFIAANLDMEFDEILLAIDARWPTVRFKIVCAAFLLENHQRFNNEPRGRLQ